METEEILWVTVNDWETPTLSNLDRLIHSVLIENRANFHVQGIHTDKKLKYPAAEGQNGAEVAEHFLEEAIELYMKDEIVGRVKDLGESK